MLYESQTFRLEVDDQVLTLWLDFRGRPNQTLTLPALNELSLVLDRAAALPAPAVVVLRSSRPGAFLEEFDAGELARFGTPLEFAALARRGQDVARKLARLSAPTVALIEGRCAGAGLELALACDYRFAAETPHTRFESPEVSRGLVPAWGGTRRLPRLIGVRAALRLMLGDESLGAGAARRAGLIDRLVAPAQAAVQLRDLIDRLRDGPAPAGGLRRLWRGATAAMFGTLALRPSGDGNPDSPENELLRAVAAGLSSEGEGLAAERAALGRLADREETRRLLSLHREAARPVRVFPEPANPVPPMPRRVGIVGGGEVGVTLACRLVGFGHEVIVHDPEAGDGVGRRVVERTAAAVLSSAEARRVAAAIQTTAGWVGFENADLVIEAGAEDPGVKRNLFHELEHRVRPRVPLATAGTTVPVDLVQAEMARPGRIAGLHFPNPDDRRPVAEVVGTSITDPVVIAALSAWARRWGFVPVRVGDRPGRLVELVRLAYLSEGVALVAEGMPIGRVDAACRKFGMARGPLEWCDEIGMDRLAERTACMQAARGDGFARNLLFQRLLPYGCVGRAVGEGFYRYGRTARPNPVAAMVLWQDLDDDALAPYVFDPDEAMREGLERLVLRTVNEAAAALTDEPDSDPAAVDLALAFGMGWAPHRGGPLRYADALGLSAVVDRLSFLAERFGPRLAPCDELIRRAEAGESFHGGAESGTRAPAWRLVG